MLLLFVDQKQVSNTAESIRSNNAHLDFKVLPLGPAPQTTTCGTSATMPVPSE